MPIAPLSTIASTSYPFSRTIVIRYSYLVVVITARVFLPFSRSVLLLRSLAAKVASRYFRLLRSGFSFYVKDSIIPSFILSLTSLALARACSLIPCIV